MRVLEMKYIVSAFYILVTYSALANCFTFTDLLEIINTTSNVIFSSTSGSSFNLTSVKLNLKSEHAHASASSFTSSIILNQKLNQNVLLQKNKEKQKSTFNTSQKQDDKKY